MARACLTPVCSAPRSRSWTQPLNTIKRLLRELPDLTTLTSRASEVVWGALQRVVLPDLGLEHRLHCGRGLSCPGDLRL